MDASTMLHRKDRVLIIGAREGSLGEHIARSFSHLTNYRVTTAGVSGAEDRMFEFPLQMREMELLHEADHVVCTIGINEGFENYHEDIGAWLAAHMKVNVEYPMTILREWIRVKPKRSPSSHFVAVSSNSAHIARGNSMAYCASKAALSMAIRCAGRDVARATQDAIIYGYEPGLLMGTPMTKQTEERFGPSQTRIPGNEAGLPVHAVADQIATTVAVGGWALNGTLVRLDGGEQ